MEKQLLGMLICIYTAFFNKNHNRLWTSYQIYLCIELFFWKSRTEFFKNESRHDSPITKRSSNQKKAQMSIRTATLKTFDTILTKKTLAKFGECDFEINSSSSTTSADCVVSVHPLNQFNNRSIYFNNFWRLPIHFVVATLKL